MSARLSIAQQTALATWVREALDLDERAVLWSPVGESRPPLPYVTLRVVTGLSGGGVETRYGEADDAMTERVVIDREMVVSVQAFGATTAWEDDAIAALTDATLELETSARCDALEAHGLAHVQTGDIRDLTALVGPTHESRAQVDVTFRVRLDRASTRLSAFFNVAAVEIAAGDRTLQIQTPAP